MTCLCPSRRPRLALSPTVKPLKVTFPLPNTAVLKTHKDRFLWSQLAWRGGADEKERTCRSGQFSISEGGTFSGVVFWLRVPKSGCFKPGCLQTLRRSALLCSFAHFCALVRSFADLCLRSIADLCLRSFALICAFLCPTAFRTTVFGSSGLEAQKPHQTVFAQGLSRTLRDMESEKPRCPQSNCP